MLKWSGILFILLGLFFVLSYNHLANIMLTHEAKHILNYQGPEFSKHLQHNQLQEIDSESASLISADEADGVIITNAHNQVTNASFNNRFMPDSAAQLKSGASSVEQIVKEDRGAILFKRYMPKANASLWLIMNRHSVLSSIFTSTAGIAFLLVAMLAIAIASLHYALRRRLVAPVEEVQQFLDTEHPSADLALQKLETSLPEETINILHLYEQLKTSHEGLRSHFSQMLDIVPSCLWWADKHGRYQQISKRASELLGLSTDELVGTPLWHWMVDLDQAKTNRGKLENAVHQRAKHLSLAYADTPPGEQPRWYGEQLTIQYNHAGAITGVYGICNDISERRQKEHSLQSHLEQARRMETIGTLVGGIAHEFNNMLAGIVGNIFLLRQGMESNSKALERLDRIDRLIERASGMINQLLAFARKGQTQRKKLALKALIEETLRIFQPSMKSGAKITADLHFGASVLADRAQIQQAITHLLDNADRALLGVSDPTIAITLNEFDGDKDFLDQHSELSTPHLLHLEVSDNGCGIEPDVVDHIFEPFFTTREIGDGTGLGLSMIYGMVRHLGGSIDVDSSLGKGTTFHLYLPRAETLSLEEEASGEIRYGKGETILLVEDETVMRKVAAEVLEKLGYNVIEAADGASALRCFEEHQQNIDLLMADLIMPIMGGTKIALTIRKKAPDLPVLFITAHNLSSSLEMDISIPRSSVVSKPFPIATLSTMLRDLINFKPPPDKA